MTDLSLNQTGQQTLTVSNTAVALTVPSGRPKHALIYVGTNPVRWGANGTTPVGATTGMYVPSGDYIDWTEPHTDFFGLINTVKFIRDGGADATIEIQYFG